MNRCPTCGSTYPAEARFCTRDGSRLVSPPPVVRPPAAAPAAAPSAAPSAAPPAAPPREPSSRDTLTGRIAARKASSHTNLTGQVLDGRYQVERKLGEGGMSFVYLVLDVATRERHAIKVLSKTLSGDENAMARLRREASLGMRLAHPNVCHIIRLGETQDGMVYVVMPFVEGEVLSDRVNRLSTLPMSETVRYVRDIAAGLHVAHELNILHRDLKPENVMISRASGTEAAVVMDFGLAKERRADAELQKLTATGIILGTPEFMSPEQLRGKPLDRRTDVYSLSLMTFEMLTGRLPFGGRTQQEMMIARLRNEPTPLRQVQSGIEFSEATERVLLRAMSRDREARHETAPEFAAALAEAASGKEPDGGLFGRLFKR